ncbi:MAG: alkaline phosphatase D family protein, partial [Methylophilaceae bacterium]
MQIILLDNRTFRDNLLPYRGEVKNDPRYKYELDYAPHTSKDSTLLGEAQWQWLEQELRKPADLRIIGSSTQFSIEFNGYEAWANFPHEQARMLNLIK